MTNSSCAGFSLITASRQDTTETLRQILVHNSNYRVICEQGGLQTEPQGEPHNE
ncbi:hypothetical protein [Lonepinella koalarum]|uniref:hypothetical protein n=1 Tax=Lonepinella koalarum TaxID=53417 RepID=UPI003F6DEFC0